MNPFDELDLELTDAERASLEGQPMPSFMQRFNANAEQAYFTGTIAGGTKGQTVNQLHRDIAVEAYDAMPQWETPLDAVAALGGQIWGSLQSPENFTPIGPGAKAAEFVGVKSAPWMARFFAGAVDAGLANAGVDAVVQGAELAGADRQAYDPVQTLVATGLGAAIGGTAGMAFGRGTDLQVTDGVKPVDVSVDLAVGARPETPVPDVVDVVLPDLATGVTMGGDATGVLAPVRRVAVEAELPALGDVLDVQARAVRGLPKREVAMAVEGNQPPSLSSKTEILENSPSKAAKGNQSLPLPDELAALAQGPRRGMLRRDDAGVASAPEEVLEPPAFTRLKDTAEELMTRLEAVAVRMGRIATRKADGIYKLGSGVIRLRKPDDFDVLAHELGHHVEVNIGKPVKDLMAVHDAELVPMAYAGADPKLLREEGFAEYMRSMVTNPGYAAQQAPAFDAAFRAMLAKDEPDVLKALDAAATAWRTWLEQPSTTAVASTIVSSVEPKYFAKFRKDWGKYGLGGTIAERIQGFYTAAFDELNPLNRAVRALARTAADNTGQTLDLKVADDAYKLARLARGGYNAGHMDIVHGVTPYRDVKPATSSLRDAIVMAMGKANVLSKWDERRLQQFGSYLWSRRALGEWDRFDQGLIPNPPDKLTRGDHVQNVTDLEAAFPAFVNAAPMVHDFAQGLWTKKFEAGLITREQYDAGLQIKDYVPGLRAFDQAGDAAGGVGKAAGDKTKGGFVKRFQGSQRDVLNPIESLMADAYQTANAIARNDVIRALDRLALKAGPGGGAIAERIASHELKATEVGAVEAVMAAAKAQGLSATDLIVLKFQVEDVLGEGAAGNIFRPAMINEKGEAIAFFRDGGELRALRLADGKFGRDMMTALNGMTRRESHVMIELLAKPAAVLRAGITSAPEFLLANFIRDQTMSAIFYGNPLKRLTGAAGGMADELFGREAARHYNMAGGIMGGANVAAAMDTRLRMDLQGLRKKGWVAQRSSIEGMLQATELSETGMRMGLFKSFHEEAKGRGLTDIEAMLEAAYRARDHIDFDRRGSVMAGLSRLIPFLNASMQGLDKGWRQMIQPLYRPAVTVAEQRATAEAVKAHARLMALTLFSMGLHALMSKHEEYNDLSPQTRATHWMIKLGDKWLAVPKPFELGAVINLGDAAWDAIVKKDPRWSEAYLQGLYEVALPPNVMEGNPLIRTAFEAKTGVELRSGNPIVPPGMEGLEPFLQFSARTSDFSKQLGAAINESPAMIDHMIVSFSGSIGRSALSLFDYAASDKPMPGWDDMPFTRRFIKDGARGASSTRAFWDMVSSRNGTLAGAANTYDKMVEAGDAGGAADFLAAQDGVTKVWVSMAATKPEVRRLHPFTRARSAVSAINDLRRDIMQSAVKTAGEPVQVNAQDRGVVDDILEDLAMAEARNALVMMKVPGWDAREVMETAGYYRELAAVSAPLATALADRFATAKVLPLDVVEKLWPELERRVLRDGSDLLQGDLVARAKTAGFEMDGKAMKRKARAKVKVDQP